MNEKTPPSTKSIALKIIYLSVGLSGLIAAIAILFGNRGVISNSFELFG